MATAFWLAAFLFWGGWGVFIVLCRLNLWPAEPPMARFEAPLPSRAERKMEELKALLEQFVHDLQDVARARIMDERTVALSALDRTKAAILSTAREAAEASLGG